MKIFYTSDGEQSTTMQLSELISNFRESDLLGFKEGDARLVDMQIELESRGWYESTHDFGRFLVLNIEKLGLAAN